MKFKLWLEDTIPWWHQSSKNFSDYPPMEWYENPLPKNLKAFHGGGRFDKFDLDHLGEGEYMSTSSKMFPALGFGIYFSDCKSLAALYTKHSEDPAIQEVLLDTENLYDLRNGSPKGNQALYDVLKELNKTIKDSPFRTFGIYEGLFRGMDKHQAIKLLTKHGIDGAFTRLPSGCYEISVTNLDIIKKVDMEYPVTTIPMYVPGSKV